MTDLTAQLAPAIREAVGYLRRAQERVQFVSSSIYETTHGFANPSYDKHGSTELDRTLSDALTDISSAIGTLADESEMSTQERDMVERRYAAPDSWFRRLHR